MTTQHNNPNARGKLRAIAFRATDGDPMTEIESCEIQVGRGIALENRKPGKRELTLISAEKWEQTCRDLGVSLPWHSRRANVLIEGIDLQAACGRMLSIGPVQVRVHGETRGCAVMDRQHQGLRAALAPEFRAGVHGEVVIGGRITVGDAVTVSP